MSFWLSMPLSAVITGLISFGLRRLSPTIVSIYIYMQPVIAAYIATLVGQDRITLVMVVSALCIFAGVYFVSRQKQFKFLNIVAGR